MRAGAGALLGVGMRGLRGEFGDRFRDTPARVGKLAWAADSFATAAPHPSPRCGRVAPAVPSWHGGWRSRASLKSGRGVLWALAILQGPPGRFVPPHWRRAVFICLLRDRGVRAPEKWGNLGGGGERIHDPYGHHSSRWGSIIDPGRMTTQGSPGGLFSFQNGGRGQGGAGHWLVRAIRQVEPGRSGCRRTLPVMSGDHGIPPCGFWPRWSGEGVVLRCYSPGSS